MGRARFAVTLIFALNGLTFATIFSRMPSIQERVGIDDGALGLALVALTGGLLVSQVAAGALIARFGSRHVVTLGLAGWSLALVPVALAESLPALALGLAMVGLANGQLDVSMNVHGLTVEGRLGRAMFTGLHAAFSFGGLAGAAIGGLVAALGVGVTEHLVSVALITAVVAVLTRGSLLPRGADAAPGGPLFAVPSRELLAVGAFAFCVLLAEGAMNDWSAVYLAREVGTADSVAAIGLAVFSLSMGVGRLFGDRLIERLGAVPLARGGATLAAVGIGLALVGDDVALALAGFAVAGIGLSALFPLALRGAATRGAAVGPSVAAVAGCGYLGLLTGPPSVGGLSALTGLRTALVLVLAMCLIAVLLARSTGGRGG